MASFPPFRSYSINEGLELQFDGCNVLSDEDDLNTYFVSEEGRSAAIELTASIKLPERIGRLKLENAILSEDEVENTYENVEPVIQITCPSTRHMIVQPLAEHEARSFSGKFLIDFEDIFQRIEIKAFLVRKTVGEKKKDFASEKGSILLRWPPVRVFLDKQPPKKGSEFKAVWKSFDDLAPDMSGTILHLYDETEETAYLNENADEGLRKILKGEPGYKQFATMILTPIAVDIREQIARSAIEQALIDGSLDGLIGNKEKCLQQMLPMLMGVKTLDDAKRDFEEKIETEEGRSEVRLEIIGEMLPKVCQHQNHILANMNRSAVSLIKMKEKEMQNDQ